MLLRGTRAGILEGDLAPAPRTAPMVLYFGWPPVGVFVADRGGGGPLIELPGRDIGWFAIELAGRDGGCGRALALEALGGGPEGVFERGGGCFAGAGASSSR